MSADSPRVAQLAAHEIQAALESIERDAAIFDERRFARRADAIDDLEVHIIDRIDGLLQAPGAPEKLMLPLRQAAEQLWRRLELVDDALFGRLRADIRSGGLHGLALGAVIDAYSERGPNAGPADAPGYDILDIFVNRLLAIPPDVEETRVREPEMVAYQPTPARVILALVARAQLTPQDVFYDLGSGLGHVPIMVNLLSGAAALGVEYDAAYCAVARARAADLSLTRVMFVNADARDLDYADGTAFFLYTPFMGRILDLVLAKLRAVAQVRPIRIFTYGPCTPIVVRQEWLWGEPAHGDPQFRLGVFSSR